MGLTQARPHHAHVCTKLIGHLFLGFLPQLSFSFLKLQLNFLLCDPFKLFFLLLECYVGAKIKSYPSFFFVLSSLSPPPPTFIMCHSNPLTQGYLCDFRLIERSNLFLYISLPARLKVFLIKPSSKLSLPLLTFSPLHLLTSILLSASLPSSSHSPSTWSHNHVHIHVALNSPAER